MRTKLDVNILQNTLKPKYRRSYIYIYILYL